MIVAGGVTRPVARPLAFGLTLALLVLAAYEWAYAWFGPPHYRNAVGVDLDVLTSATARLLNGESWFLDRQLHGPYPMVWGEVLYPPVTAYLFAPFIVLGVVPFVAIPVVGTALLVRGWRPAPWTWPLMALCLLWPTTFLKAVAGNPSLWVMLTVGLGLRYGWGGALVLLKPSFLPFALIGIWRRSWWITAGVLGLLSLPFLAATLQYPGVLLDHRGSGLDYSLVDVPMVLIPVIAWMGATRLRTSSRS